MSSFSSKVSPLMKKKVSDMDTVMIVKIEMMRLRMVECRFCFLRLWAA